MGSKATYKKGVLEVEDSGTPGTWIQIGCLRSLRPPGVETNQVDGTCTDDAEPVGVEGDDVIQTAEATISFIASSTASTVDKIISDFWAAKTSENWRARHPSWDDTVTWTGKVLAWLPNEMNTATLNEAVLRTSVEGAVGRGTP